MCACIDVRSACIGKFLAYAWTGLESARGPLCVCCDTVLHTALIMYSAETSTCY
jgi:hypothetical protein